MSSSPCRPALAAARLPRRAAPVLTPVVAPVVAALLLAGCHYASSPLVGFGGFVSNTHTARINPNLPPGSDETMLRSEARGGETTPLLPEAGNVWPGPPPPVPSLEDVQREQNIEQPLPPPNLPSGSPPAPGETAPPRVVVPPPLPPTPAFPALKNPPPPAQVIPTPQGPLINNGPVGVPGGVGTATNPAGGQSIVVPNGNGTSTIIAPDGSTQTVPTPK